MSTDEYVPSEAEMIAGLVQLPDEPAGLCRRVRPDEMKRGLARVRRDAAREALGGLFRKHIRSSELYRDSSAMATFQRESAHAAITYRDTHYPETEDQP